MANFIGQISFSDSLRHPARTLLARGMRTQRSCCAITSVRWARGARMTVERQCLRGPSRKRPPYQGLNAEDHLLYLHGL
eukprot:6529902-Prymnesium_polylepis.2